MGNLSGLLPLIALRSLRSAVHRQLAQNELVDCFANGLELTARNRESFVELGSHGI